jgi:hypothetical protein
MLGLPTKTATIIAFGVMGSDRAVRGAPSSGSSAVHRGTAMTGTFGLAAVV